MLPADLRAFLKTGAVHESLRPTVAAATQMVGDYAADLGAESAADLTAGQRAALHNLFRATVASNGIFGNFLRDANPDSLEKLGPYQNAELRALGLLGIQKRKAREVDLSEYLDAKYTNQGETE